MDPRLITFHTHSDFSDGKAPLGAMFAAFTAEGFTQIAFTDHYASLAAGPLPSRLNEGTLPGYLDACASLGLAAGLEVEIITEDGPAIRERERASAAFTLGGLHRLLGVRFFDDPSPIHDGLAYVRLLRNVLLDAMRSGLLDAVAHPTKLPDSIRTRSQELLDASWRAPLIEAAARGGVAFDLNEDSRVPDVAFVRECRQAGVRLLVASDAHTLAEARPLAFVGAVCDEAGITDADLFVPSPRTQSPT